MCHSLVSKGPFVRSAWKCRRRNTCPTKPVPRLYGPPLRCKSRKTAYLGENGIHYPILTLMRRASEMDHIHDVEDRAPHSRTNLMISRHPATNLLCDAGLLLRHLVELLLGAFPTSFLCRRAGVSTYHNYLSPLHDLWTIQTYCARKWRSNIR